MTTPANPPTPREVVAMANAAITEAVELIARDARPAAQRFADALDSAAEQVGQQFADAIEQSGLFPGGERP